MLFAITACVLACVVPLVVGAVLHTWWSRALISTASTMYDVMSTTRERSETSFRELSVRLSGVESDVKNMSSTHVAGELAVLAADVEKLALSCRKQFGSVWAELHHAGVLKAAEQKQLTDETPEQTRARLRTDIALAHRHALNLNSGGTKE